MLSGKLYTAGKHFKCLLVATYFTWWKRCAAKRGRQILKRAWISLSSNTWNAGLTFAIVANVHWPCSSPAWEWSWIKIPEDAHDHKDHEQGGPRAGWLIDWRSFPVFASPSLPTEPAPPHPCYQVLHFSTNGIFFYHSIGRKKLCHHHIIKYTCPKWGQWDLVLDIVNWGGHDWINMNWTHWLWCLFVNNCHENYWYWNIWRALRAKKLNAWRQF